MYSLNNYWFSEYDKYGLPTFLIDINMCCVLKANKEVISLLRLRSETPSSLEGISFSDLHRLSELELKDELDKVISTFSRVAERGECMHSILRFTDLDGVSLPLGLVLFPIRNIDDIIETVAVVLLPYNKREDISVITYLYKELEDEQRRSHLLIDSAPFGCIVFDTKFQPVSCNAICVSLFKEKSKSSLLANLSTYLFEGVCDIEHYEGYVVLRDKLYTKGSFQLSATHLTAEGGYFESSMTMTLIKYRDENQIVVYFVDMSEQRRVLDMYAELAYEASMDKLTGVKNRGHFDTKVQVMITEHRATEKPLYLVMMDIDDFKLINDTYGHVVGDDVLKGLGTALCTNIRPMDVIARYGGEEFAVLFENMSLAAVTKKIETLRRVIEEMEIRVQYGTSSRSLKITVSIGLAKFNPETMADGEDLCECADRALYQAKHEGKNCFRIYER